MVAMTLTYTVLTLALGAFGFAVLLCRAAMLGDRHAADRTAGHGHAEEGSVEGPATKPR
jgi:hypothetical protein